MALPSGRSKARHDEWDWNICRTFDRNRRECQKGNRGSLCSISPWHHPTDRQSYGSPMECGNLQVDPYPCPKASTFLRPDGSRSHGSGCKMDPRVLYAIPMNLGLSWTHPNGKTADLDLEGSRISLVGASPNTNLFKPSSAAHDVVRHVVRLGFFCPEVTGQVPCSSWRRVRGGR